MSTVLYVGLTFDSIIAGQSNLNNEISIFQFLVLAGPPLKTQDGRMQLGPPI